MLERLGSYAPIPIRIFSGVFLVYTTQDHVRSSERMAELASFLDAQGFPMPAVCARASVYVQFLGGILLALGALTKPVAALIAVNFVVAIAAVHVGLPFRTWLEPCAMLACALALALGGAGKLSIDWLVQQRRSRR